MKTPSTYGRWSNAKKSPPKMDGHYIIYAPSADPNSPFIAMAWYSTITAQWSLLPECWCEAITHWMPKPKPPTPKTGAGRRKKGRRKKKRSPEDIIFQASYNIMRASAIANR